MHPAITRGMTAIAIFQAAVSLAALASSLRAAAVCAAVGVLAIARYAAVSLYASSVCARRGAAGRFLATSAWLLSFAALGVAIAAVGLRAAEVLPWAAAAAFAGPVGMAVLAFGSGIFALAAGGRR